MAQNKANNEPNRDERLSLDSDTLFSGFLFGLSIGAVIALFRAPRIEWKPAREKAVEVAENVRGTVAPPSDPLKDSLAEGRKVAHQRRARNKQ